MTEELTTAAVLLARTYYEACAKAESIADDWDELEVSERVILSEAMQMLLDIGVVQQISYKGFQRLRDLGWRSGIAKNRHVLGVPLK